MTDMLPVYPLPDRRAITRSFLSLPLSEETLQLSLPLLVECEAAVGDIYKKYTKVVVRISERAREPDADWRGWIQQYSRGEGRGRKWFNLWHFHILFFVLGY